MKRTALVQRLADLVGPSLTLVDVRKGWPALAELKTATDSVPLSMFVASVIRGHRAAYELDERRVENPGQGKPIIIPPSTVPVILGLWQEDEHEVVARPVLMAADAWKRQGLMTRHSVFVRFESLRAAMLNGWDVRTSDADEQITCFWPERLAEYVETELLPAFATALAKVETSTVYPGEPRNRRSSSQLVRSARFGARVLAAYNSRCALCDLNLGLVQAAHVYPAAAPDSCDEPWNGISLCANHHAAFDRHHLFVHPVTRQVSIHPWLSSTAQSNVTCQHFIASTARVLKEPRDVTVRPRAEMFRQRYRFFENSYDWADSKRTWLLAE